MCPISCHAYAPGSVYATLSARTAPYLCIYLHAYSALPMHLSACVQRPIYASICMRTAPHLCIYVHAYSALSMHLSACVQRRIYARKRTFHAHALSVIAAMICMRRYNIIIIIMSAGHIRNCIIWGVCHNDVAVAICDGPRHWLN